MGTTSDKLTYLNDTKTLLRTNINALGGDLDTDDTFRSYADELDAIWEELPHTTGTGTSLSLATKAGKMKVNLLGNTSQYTTTGKNLIGYDNSLPYTLYDITLSRENDNYKITGTATNYFYKKIFTIPAGTLNGTYLLKKFNLSGTSLAQIRVVDRVATPNSVKAETNSQTTFSIDNTHNDLDVEITTDNHSQYNETFNILMQLSSITDTSYEPYTGGIASPNPTYPQDVHIVSGDNTIVSTGKNLFNAQIQAGVYGNTTYTVSSNGEISQSSTDTSAFGNGQARNFQLSAGTYTISILNRPSNVYLQLRNISNNTNILENKTDSYTFTLNETTTLACKTWSSDTSLYPISYYIQIEKGNTATTYEPYTSTSYPIHLGEYELCKISTYQDRFIRTTGKNLFDKDNVVKVENKILNDSGTEINDAGGAYTKMYMPVKPSTTYVTSGMPNGGTDRIYFFDNTKTFISRTSGYTNLSTFTFTTPSNCYYVDVQYYMGNNNFNLWQIEEGSIATSYEPYGTNEWYLEKKIGKVVLDGSEDESWGIVNTANGKRFYLPKSDAIVPTSSANATILSDNFSYMTPSKSWTDDIVGISLNTGLTSGQILVKYNTSDTDTVAKFKTWLSSHNTKAIYQLATPTYTQITGTLKDELEAVWRANSYKGTTNVSQVNNDLPFIIDATALEVWS